jgi:hypothetical protein
MKHLWQSGFVCLGALFAAACSGADAQVASSSQDFLVPAKVPIKLEKVLYKHDMSAGFMGDGCAVIVGIIEKESFDSFVLEHAEKEIEWSAGPFHIGEVGIKGNDYVKWLSGWLEAHKVTEDLGKVVDWKSLLRLDGGKRYYRIRYDQHQVDHFGKRTWEIECAELWLIDIESRTFVHILVNT